jgi:hypothetical protein
MSGWRAVAFAPVFILAACQSVVEVPTPAPPPPPPFYPPAPPSDPLVSSPSPTPAALPVIATRDFIIRGERTFGGEWPYPLRSVLLLKANGGSKNRVACEQFVGLAETAVAPTVVGDATFVPTFWLLSEQVSDRRNCTQLLAKYDFEAASLLMQRYGVPISSRGPVLVVADREGKYAFLDVSRANNNKVREAVRDWGRMMTENGMQNITLQGTNLGSVLKSLACNTTQQIVAERVPAAGADPTNPSTFGFNPATLRWERPSLFSIGTLVFGGPFTRLACGTA